MSKAFSALLLLTLSACAALPPRQDYAARSPCATSEASYECQVERYQNVNAD